MKSVLLLSFVTMAHACCGPPAFTTCCMAYAPPTIIGYQRIPIFARVPKRRIVQEGYDLEEVPPVLPPQQEPVLVQEPPPQAMQEIQPMLVQQPAYQTPPNVVVQSPLPIAPAYAQPQTVQNVVLGNSRLPMVVGGMFRGPAQFQRTGSRLSFAEPPMPSYNQPPQGPPMPMYNEGPGPQLISQGQPMPIYNEGPQSNGMQPQLPQLYGNEIGNSGEFQPHGQYQPRQIPYPGNAPNAKALRQ